MGGVLPRLTAADSAGGAKLYFVAVLGMVSSRLLATFLLSSHDFIFRAEHPVQGIPDDG